MIVGIVQTVVKQQRTLLKSVASMFACHWDKTGIICYYFIEFMFYFDYNHLSDAYEKL